MIKKVIEMVLLISLSALDSSATNFENLLDKNIEEAFFIGEFKKFSNSYVIYKPKEKFLGKSIMQITITTDSNKVILSIMISFQKPTEKSFYKKISNQYGVNYDVMILGEIFSKKISMTENNDGFKQTLIQTESELKKGSIKNSNISHIIWTKEHYKLLFLINNTNSIHFIKNTNHNHTYKK